MGTSKSYSASVKGQPQWGELSSEVTRNCTTAKIPTDNLRNITGKFVRVVGGSKRAGRGNSRIAGRSGIRNAKNIGRFLGSFSSNGGNLSEALKSIGLTDLKSKSAEDIINHLIEYCSGPASTIDDSAAKEATRRLLEELAAGTETAEDLETSLKSTLDSESLEEVIIKYFSYYVLEHLSIMFYEKLVESKGKTECSSLFKQIKDFINSSLAEMNKTNSLDKIDWGGDDGDGVIKNIQEDVLKVFEDEN
jgi:hypothetical protein